MNTSISSRSRLVTLLLCWFLGFFGAHRFYVNKYGTAVLMALTFGGVGVWWFIDLIFIVCGIFRDKQDRRIFQWFEEGSLPGQTGGVT